MSMSLSTVQFLQSLADGTLLELCVWAWRSVSLIAIGQKAKSIHEHMGKRQFFVKGLNEELYFNYSIWIFHKSKGSGDGPGPADGLVPGSLQGGGGTDLICASHPTLCPPKEARGCSLESCMRTESAFSKGPLLDCRQWGRGTSESSLGLPSSSAMCPDLWSACSLKRLLSVSKSMMGAEDQSHGTNPQDPLCGSALSLCVCACARVWACVFACERGCVCVCA